MIERERLAVALDVADRRRLLALVDRLVAEVGFFKIGAIPFTAFGPELVREVAARRPVFLDLKLHDIPNTVAGAVRATAGLGVALLTIHAAGGAAMVAAAAEAAAAVAPRPRILAVTVLTHLLAADLEAVGVERPLDDQVLALARLARSAGADGLVCSPHEVARLRQELGPDAMLVVPGVRPAWAEAGDQRRIATPAEAIAAGADLLVVGRPILATADPAAAAARIRREG